MNTLNSLPKTSAKSQKRRGRGIGSGVGGHTTGRGAKGDKARGKTKITFDGTKIKKSWIKRLPFLRGKHLTLKRSHSTIFHLGEIDRLFIAGKIVSSETLKAKNVKILAGGQLTKALTFKGVAVSAGAKEQILAAGGTITQ